MSTQESKGPATESATSFVAAEAGRADVVVGRALGLSRRQLGKLFSAAAVRVDGRVARKGDSVGIGQQILVDAVVTSSSFDPVPQPSSLEPVFVSADFVALNKPASWSTHPLVADETDTAANWLVAHYPETIGIGDDPREAGFVHRLDRGTTGILLAARNRDAWVRLRDQFRRNVVAKQYWALVEGAASDGESVEPLVRRGQKTMVASASDRKAVSARSQWRVRSRHPLATLLEVEIKTGRMHQIRAHLSAAGHPVVGDLLYGGAADDRFAGHFLHARRLRFGALHTPKGSAAEWISIEAPLPPERARLLAEADSD